MKKKCPRARWRRRALAGVLALLGGASGLQADYQQAIIYYGRGMYDKAIQEIKPDVEANVNWEPGHRILGLCYFQTKQYGPAIHSLTRAVQLKSPEFSTYLSLAYAYSLTNQAAKVPGVLSEGERTVIKEKISADQRYELSHLRGAAHFQQKQYHEAIRDLTEALRLRSNDFADVSQLGYAYYYTRRFEEAIATLTKAAALKPGDTTVPAVLADCYQKRGAAALKDKQYAKAVEDLSKALTYNPKDGSTHYNLGMAQLFLSRLDDAERALLRAAELLPGQADPYQQLGYVYEKKKQYPKALDAYKKAYDVSKSPELKASIDRVTQAGK